MSKIEIPEAIIEYIGIRPIFGSTGKFVNKLNITIQTIGHIIFSSENTQLKWNQSEAIERPIFSQFLTQDFEGSFHIDSPRFFKNALREIIPIECRKRANRKITKFSETEMNRSPLIIPDLIYQGSKGEIKIDFYRLGIVLNAVALTKKLLADNLQISAAQLFDLPVLKQLIEKMNQKEINLVNYALSRCLKK